MAFSSFMLGSRMAGNLLQRYSKDGRGDWQISEIASHANGGLIVAGFSRELRQTCIDIISKENKAIFEKTFSHKGDADIDDRFVASMSSEEIVTGCGRKVQVIRTLLGTNLSTYTLKRGPVTCLGVSSSQSIIYVGRIDSSDLLVLGRDMKLRQTISIPTDKIYGVIDVAAFNDRIIVCSASGALMSYGHVTMVDVTSNQTIAEYKTILGKHFCPKSLILKEDTNSLLILWSFTSASEYDTEFEYHITYHSLDVGEEYCQALSILTESARKIAATRDNKLAILDADGDITITDIGDFFNVDNLIKSLSELLRSEDCIKLCTSFEINEEQAAKLFTSRKPGKSLLNALEGKLIFQRTDLTSLRKAFANLNMSNALHLVEGYLKKRRTPLISTFEKFIADFSTFLTSNHFEAVCEHFKISTSEKSEMLSDSAPGLSLLATLNAKGIITPTDVSALEIPAFSQLKQVIAKINRYQEDIIKSGESSLENQRELTPEEKRQMFTDYLCLNTKNWYESICPLPWKKASQWGLSDLFIACGLTLTDTKCHTVLKNIDPNCNVTYGDIFTHKELNDAPRIVVEGNPGSGKTMLASQIAYDWMKGKIKDIKYAILLQLKYVENMTLSEAITKLILPVKSPLTKTDVEAILAESDTFKVCLILDGLEEYTGGGSGGGGGGGSNTTGPAQSEVMKVMNREKLSECKVIITTRSEYLEVLPKCPLLKIRQFGKEERHKYVEKLFPNDDEKQRDVRKAVENDPLLLELCDVPLLFVMAVHNIDRITKVSEGETERVTPFVRNIIDTLCIMGGKGERLQDELEEGMGSSDSDSDDSDFSDTVRLTLEEVAFNGLCTGKLQQLSWPMGFVQDGISNVRLWIDSGIFIVEEVRRIKEDITEQSEQATMVASAEAAYLMTVETNEEGEVSAMDIDFDGGARSEDKQQPLGNVTINEISKKALIVLRARFLHKIIQEWFAAKHLANLLENYNYDDVHRCLDLINPIELHYILRFACGINDSVTPLILTYLDRHYRLNDDKRGPVSDCFCQCFLEHNGDREVLKETVRNFYKEGITICEEDSRQLQKAKISLLNFASENKISVLKVKLVDVCERLLDQDKENVISLQLNSGVYLTPLKEVHSLMITSWDPKLEDFDYVLLMKYLDEWPSLQEVDLHFPVPPPTLDEEKDNLSLIHKKVLVTWTIGQITNRLDENGEWKLKNFKGKDSSPVPGQHQRRKLEDEPTPMQSLLSPWKNFRGSTSMLGATSPMVMAETRKLPPDSQDDGNREDENNIPKVAQEETHFSEVAQSQLADCQPSLDKEATITNTGGVLEIPNTGVVLVVPPNAIPGNMEQCTIEMRIISHRMEEDQEASFSSNSSAIVELLPDNLMLQRPVKLMLPHCLVLKETKDYTARIFISHHKKGSPPQWVEQTHLSYHLEDTTCTILLESFCWVKYCVDDKLVTAKKIVVYAAAQNLLPQDDVATLVVGYYGDLPGRGSTFLQSNPSFIVSDKKTFFFRKRKKCYSLHFSLDKIFPNGWQCPEETRKEVPYKKIASMSKEHSLVYLLEKKDNIAGNPLCVFTASQERGQMPVHLAVYPQATHMDSLPTSEIHMHLPQGQAFRQIEANISQTGGTVEISDTGVGLEIPPGALPAGMEQCKIQMRIIPSRRVQDEVVSFSSNSSVAVELRPDDLRFQHPVRLKLPHCLELQENPKHSVRIFTKHHSEESQSEWEEKTDLLYCLEDATCNIWMDKLCCVKYSIYDEIVIGKKIVVYTAARKDIEKKEIADVEVGYYPHMPGGGELLRMNPNLIMNFRNILYYKEKERSPLQLSLESIVPSGWTCCFPEQNPQEIPFRMIAWSVEHSHLFILQKTNERAGNHVCKFTATQEMGDIPIELVVKLCPQGAYLSQLTADFSPLGSHSQPGLMSPSHDDVMKRTIRYLSRELGPKWESVGRELGLEDSDLYQIKSDNKGTQEVIHGMLVCWQQKKGSQATYPNLIKSLEMAGRKDLAEKVQNFALLA